MTNGLDYIPEASGSPLTKKQVEQVATMVFNRFIHYGNFPTWDSPFNAKIRKYIIQQVTRVIESMQLCGIEIRN